MKNIFKNIIIIIACCIFISLMYYIFVIKNNNSIDNEKIYLNYSNKEYINNEKYFKKGREKNFRNVEYIGGKKIYIDRPIGISDKEYAYVGFRWYPFYRDKDTSEILRGLEKYNFITAGIPYVGIDKMNVPNDRMTIKGFKDYILYWTGSVSCQDKQVIKNPLIRNNIKGKFYGNGIYDVWKYGNFDRPIDIIADYLWGNVNREVSDGYDLYSVEDIKNYEFSLPIIELSSTEWILNILRNCFGFVSDDFYNIYNNNIINFEKIDIKSVSIGDIGSFGDKDDGYKIGICIGYDEKRNPIFSVCTTKRYLKDINNYIIHNDNTINGFNILHIENKDDHQNNLFDSYYKTNLPFSDSTVDIKDTIIKDISIFNSQVKKENKNEMNKKLMVERVRRLTDRENIAKEIRIIEDIDLNKYTNIDISTMYLINEINSYEYQHLYNNIGEDKKNEFHRVTYDEWKKIKQNQLNNNYNDIDEKTFEQIYEASKENIKNYVTTNKDLFTTKKYEDIDKWYYEEYGGVAKIDLDILLKFLKEYPEFLD